MKNDPKYPISDWRYEVANSDTQLGYEKWLEHKREANATEDVLHVIASGLCFKSVCVPVDWDHDKILSNVFPAGTTRGWQISKDPKFATGDTNPCQCEQEDDRIHYLLDC